MAVDHPLVARYGLQLSNTVAVGQILDESDLSSNSAEAIPTQASVKSYVDNALTVSDKIEEGNTSVEVVDTGSDGRVIFTTEGLEVGSFESDGEFQLTNNLTLTGISSALALEGNTQTSGTVASFKCTPAADGTASIVNIEADGTWTGGYALRVVVKDDDVEAFRVNDGAADVFNIDRNGRVDMDGNLFFLSGGKLDTTANGILSITSNGSGYVRFNTTGTPSHSAKVYFNEVSEFDQNVFCDSDIYVASGSSIGIGTESPAYQLESAADGIDAKICVTRASTDANEPAYYLRKARGTLASLASVAESDVLGSLQAIPYVDGSWRSVAGRVEFICTSVGSTFAASDWALSLRTSANTYDEVLRVTSAGKMGLGTDSPSYHFDIAQSAASMRMTAYNNSATGAYLRLHHSRGSESSRDAVDSGDLLGVVYFGGDNGTAVYDSCSVRCATTQNWSGSGRGSNLEFYTTENDTTTFASKMKIDHDGAVYMYDVYEDTVTSARDLEIQSNGKLGYASSAKRYKKYIKDLTNVDFLYDLRPVTFKNRLDSTNERQYGLIAEDVEGVNQDFVFYNDEGELEGVHYKKFIPVLIQSNRELRGKVAYLEKKLNKLSGKGKTGSKSKEGFR